MEPRQRSLIAYRSLIGQPCQQELLEFPLAHQSGEGGVPADSMIGVAVDSSPLQTLMTSKETTHESYRAIL